MAFWQSFQRSGDLEEVVALLVLVYSGQTKLPAPVCLLSGVSMSKV